MQPSRPSPGPGSMVGASLMLVVGAIDAVPILAMRTNDSIISKSFVAGSEDNISTCPLILMGSESSKKTGIS